MESFVDVKVGDEVNVCIDEAYAEFEDGVVEEIRGKIFMVRGESGERYLFDKHNGCHPCRVTYEDKPKCLHFRPWNNTAHKEYVEKVRSIIKENIDALDDTSILEMAGAMKYWNFGKFKF